MYHSSDNSAAHGAWQIPLPWRGRGGRRGRNGCGALRGACRDAARHVSTGHPTGQPTGAPEYNRHVLRTPEYNHPVLRTPEYNHPVLRTPEYNHPVLRTPLQRRGILPRTYLRTYPRSRHNTRSRQGRNIGRNRFFARKKACRRYAILLYSSDNSTAWRGTAQHSARQIPLLWRGRGGRRGRNGKNPGHPANLIKISVQDNNN